METFVIRVYTAGSDGLPFDGRLRGVAEEISTGFQTTFHSKDELLSILRRAQHGTSGVSTQGAVTRRDQSSSKEAPK